MQSMKTLWLGRVARISWSFSHGTYGYTSLQIIHYHHMQPTTTVNAITHVRCNCIVLMIQKAATLDNIIETN